MIIVEVPKAIWKCPRVAVLETFCDWLWDQHRKSLGLPAEVIVSVRAGRGVGRGAVGRFIVEGPSWGFFPDSFLVEVAIGSIPYEDEADWAARLTTLPHELVHVGQFVRAFGGRTPAAVARSAGAGRVAIDAAFQSWASMDAEAGGAASAEAIGRRLTDAYHDAFPLVAGLPLCPPRCGCRSRNTG